MAEWVRIASRDDCPPGTGCELVVGDRILALFNVGGEFHVLDGICPHQGGPLGKGKLVGSIVTCPWHGWQFDVRSGQHQASPAICHVRLNVKMEGNDVFVEFDRDQLDGESRH